MYYVKAQEHTYEIDPPEPNPTNEPYMYQGSYGLILNVDYIYRTKQEGPDITRFEKDGYDDIYGYDEIPLGNAAFMVIVKYTTGDTFGSHGAWTMPAVKADINDAYKALAKCNKPDDKNPYRRAWDGYFEHLESVEVVHSVVL